MSEREAVREFTNLYMKTNDSYHRVGTFRPVPRGQLPETGMFIMDMVTWDPAFMALAMGTDLSSSIERGGIKLDPTNPLRGKFQVSSYLAPDEWFDIGSAQISVAELLNPSGSEFTGIKLQLVKLPDFEKVAKS